MKLDKKLLWNLLSQPTAPFREFHVSNQVKEFLKKETIPFFEDPVGNIVVGVSGQTEYLAKLKGSSSEPVRFFIAHMDHPGFHGVSWVNSNTLAVKWFGGTPTRFLNGAKVWLASKQEVVAYGVIQKAKLNKNKTALESSEVKLKLAGNKNDLSAFSAEELFGAFAFKSPVREKNKIIYTKAADDLVGVFTILSLARELKKKDTPFLALISRAEEVGFIGTIGHLQLGWLNKHKESVVVVSLETSRTLPGALIGKGPIVRLGDRATPFDPGLTQVLTQVAQKKLKTQFQRRIMDGGTCEATAALAFGLRAIGISIPLGNYHNQSFEGGPESRGKLGPAPEFVHLEDIQGMLTLCEGVMEESADWKDPWKSKKTSLESSFNKAEPLLKMFF